MAVYNVCAATGGERLQSMRPLHLIAAIALGGVVAFTACGGGSGQPNVPTIVPSSTPTGAPATAIPTNAATVPPTANTTPKASPTPTKGAPVLCEKTEQFVFHIHVLLKIFNQNKPVTVPAQIGIRPDCFYWLHTHDESGVLHVESPTQRVYTLGDFFGVWGQPLDANTLMNLHAGGGETVRAWVNGVAWTGNPADIPLRDLDQVVLAYGPPWPPGLPT